MKRSKKSMNLVSNISRAELHLCLQESVFYLSLLPKPPSGVLGLWLAWGSTASAVILH